MVEKTFNPRSILDRRILDIAYKNKLGHLGSYFSSAPIIEYIFENQNPNDIFILSSGHASLALYVGLEKYYGLDAEDLFRRHGGHPHLNESDRIYCSTGSLGMGITVAIGRALANPTRNVNVLISDGECAEGSVWESLRYIHEKNITNLNVYVNINGYAAYDVVNMQYLGRRLVAFLPSINLFQTTVERFSFLKGLNAHYHVMSEENYNQALLEI